MGHRLLRDPDERADRRALCVNAVRSDRFLGVRRAPRFTLVLGLFVATSLAACASPASTPGRPDSAAPSAAAPLATTGTPAPAPTVAATPTAVASLVIEP